MGAFVSEADLEAGLADILRSPRDAGVLRLIVRRPAVGAREVVEEGALDPGQGLVGDRWHLGPGAGGAGARDTQLNVMNARAIALVAGSVERWPLAGDQLFVDFDLSEEHLPVGARLAIGDAVIEVTAPPHTGCGKFERRFGPAAVTFVNSPAGRRLRLRGLNAKVVAPGAIRVGDVVRKT